MVELLEIVLTVSDFVIHLPIVLILGASMLISVLLWSSGSLVLEIAAVAVGVGGLVLGLLCQFKWIDSLTSIERDKNG